jgi:uncharacterized protein YraI
MAQLPKKETPMRTLLAATAVTALLLAPVGAYAQRSTQTTETQENFRAGVKAEQPTVKRQEILRGESNKDQTQTNGAADRMSAPPPASR